MTELPARRKLRVLIVDDHPLMREALRSAVELQEDMTVIAEAGDGEEAVKYALLHDPDVTIMDMFLPVKDGIEATAEIVSANPEAAILILTSAADDEKVVAALEAGAMGYLLKDAPRQQFLEALREVASGNTFMPPEVAEKLARGIRKRRHLSKTGQLKKKPLTAREHEVLMLMGKGLSNAEIAKRLHVSESTVRVHVYNILGKLYLENRNQAIVYALRNSESGEDPDQY